MVCENIIVCYNYNDGHPYYRRTLRSVCDSDICHLAFTTVQLSVTYDFLRYINILTYLLTLLTYMS